MTAVLDPESSVAPACEGSGRFPDVVNDIVRDERFYICSDCGATMPTFELTPVHGRSGGGPSF
jgi:hypothetical protein